MCSGSFASGCSVLNNSERLALAGSKTPCASRPDSWNFAKSFFGKICAQSACGHVTFQGLASASIFQSYIGTGLLHAGHAPLLQTIHEREIVAPNISFHS